MAYKPHTAPGGVRLAKSLEVLWDQVNQAYPKRSKASDGWIGDPAHASRASDHNPASDKIVHAIDITHDPKVGFDSYKFADMIRLRMDKRVSLIISNSRIANPDVQGGAWRKYSGVNAHNKHVHISVRNGPAEDDETPWNISMEGAPPAAPLPPPPVIPTEAVSSALRDQMVTKIINYEAKRDSSGHLMVHKPGDGSYEVAGLSSNSHPEIANEMRALVEKGQHVEAERRIRKFMLDFTQLAADWTTDPGVEFMLRDSIYHRGADGGARIFQLAVGAPVDGQVGPTTRGFAAKLPAEEILKRLRASREAYEIEKYTKRAKYWNGLTNRWNNAYNDALTFRAKASVPITSKEVATTAGTVAAGAGTAAVAKKTYDIDWGTVAIIIAVPLFFVVAAIVIVRKMSRKPA